jgi:hypothetical protein
MFIRRFNARKNRRAIEFRIDEYGIYFLAMSDDFDCLIGGISYQYFWNKKPMLKGFSVYNFR